MRQQVTQSVKKFTEWFLTGQSKQIVLSDKERELEELRRQMKAQLQELQNRGLPIRIVAL